MRKIFSFFTTIAVLLMPFFVQAAITLPANTGLPDSTVGGVLNSVLRFITGLIAGLALLMIVISGIMYIIAAGDSGKAEKAKDMLVTSITGLVIALLAYAIVIIIGNALGAQW